MRLLGVPGGPLGDCEGTLGSLAGSWVCSGRSCWVSWGPSRAPGDTRSPLGALWDLRASCNFCLGSPRTSKLSILGSPEGSDDSFAVALNGQVTPSGQSSDPWRDLRGPWGVSGWSWGAWGRKQGGLEVCKDLWGWGRKERLDLCGPGWILRGVSVDLGKASELM